MHVAVVDIGKPGATLGWEIYRSQMKSGADLDDCIGELGDALDESGLALGFESPQFVPMRDNPKELLRARNGECITGCNRPFSASAGAQSLVVGLVVVPYILSKLRERTPRAVASLDWKKLPSSPGQLLLFEAFVTNQRNTAPSRHEDDCRLAVEAFQRTVANSSDGKSSVIESNCFSLLGAMMLRTGWSRDLEVLSQSCLVVRG